MSWIGVDLDGTLAFYDGWKGIEHVGDPIPAMEARVREWIRKEKTVKIFTARCHAPEAIPFISAWLIYNGFVYPDGKPLEVTNVKDFAMVELWDDRAVQVEMNTGKRVDGL
ncbi:MAG: hypothetical protein V4714_17760 [Bacteroidota bacterium]